MPYNELKEIIRTQKTVSTSRLAKIEKELDRIRIQQANRINRQNKELQRLNQKLHHLRKEGAKNGKSL